VQNDGSAGAAGSVTRVCTLCMSMAAGMCYDVSIQELWCSMLLYLCHAFSSLSFLGNDVL
jgi:hypothetical protein